jgi:hypothetical protein
METMKRRLLRYGRQQSLLYESARAAGLSAVEVREILDSEPAAFTVEFADAHQFCVFLSEQLLQLLTSGEAARIFDHHVNLNPPDQEAIEREKPEEILPWLEQRGYIDEVRELTRKQICAALLADFLHFIDEALECSVKGRLTVAFALLRKPLKENLLYLEWIVADPEDFFRRFEDDSHSLAIGKPLSVEKRLAIIRGAMERSPGRVWVAPESIYELRYDKHSPIGLEPTWQQAMHLITTAKGVATESRNFNFVFSNAESHESQWRQLYGVLPALLFYAIQIIEGLVGTFARPADEFANASVALRTVAGFILWLRSDVAAVDGVEHAESFSQVVR